MYGVLYAISAEIFPAKDRGTGNGLTATATRVFGVMVRFPLYTLALALVCNLPTSFIGTRHCVVCEFGDGGTCLHCWGPDCVCGCLGDVFAV